MERKATDILLDLEDKIDKLLLHIANVDNNYKIIISRLDQLKNNTSMALRPSYPPNNQPVSIPPEPTIISAKEKKQSEFPQVDNSAASSKPDKVRVSQVVKYPKSKNSKQNNVVLASVKIYDHKGLQGGALVGENRTDQNGRWKIDLSPGDYFVHILKPASTQKPQIDHYFPINVTDEKSVLELEPLG
jgi:hypothetical protein